VIKQLLWPPLVQTLVARGYKYLPPQCPFIKPCVRFFRLKLVARKEDKLLQWAENLREEILERIRERAEQQGDCRRGRLPKKVKHRPS
jgi:hypothetical protein